ncbi:MAG: DUF4416 family protein [Candidatus Omnitrophota bacterium]
MGKICVQAPVKLVTSIIFNDEKAAEEAEKKLCKLFGKKEALEKVLPFDLTDYYSKEMGKDLKRKLICFEKLAEKEGIYDIKIRTNRIEDLFSQNGKRKVNIDPGYVTEAKLVLLTTKDYTHRIHIGRGIFAESTLCFKDGAFGSWSWSYPDYASEAMRDYFKEVRTLYVKQMKKRSE